MDQLLGFGVYLLTMTSVFLMLAVSLGMQVGQCGLVNFGQVAFMAVGAYTAAIAIGSGVYWLLAVLFAIGAGTALGVFMSLTVRNMGGTYWGILSLSVAEIIRLIALNEGWLTGGANGMSVLVTIPGLPYWVLGAAVLVVLLSRVVAASPFGRTIRLIREGDRLPQALGKNVLLFKMETMAIGGAFGGMAGAFYALLNGYISPDDALPIETFIVWAMVVLGGLGNVWGIVLGTIVVQNLYVGTRFLTSVVDIEAETISALRLVLIGVLIVVVMMFRQEGLVPERKRRYPI